MKHLEPLLKPYPPVIERSGRVAPGWDLASWSTTRSSQAIPSTVRANRTVDALVPLPCWLGADSPPRKGRLARVGAERIADLE